MLYGFIADIILILKVLFVLFYAKSIFMSLLRIMTGEFSEAINRGKQKWSVR